MTDRFKSLADETMKLHGDNFTRVNDAKLRALLEPMAQHIGRFQDELRQTHEGAAKDRERLKAEIENLTRQSEKIGQDAVALARALKGDKQKQGAWGEMVLERLLEDSGLTAGREYETQFHVRSEEGARRRPDVVVRLPGGRNVVIDAKVSLVAYDAAANAEDDRERAVQARAHAAAMRAHVEELARRDYAGMVGGAVDYVLMFTPIEPALAMALKEQPDLTAWAMSKGVAVATPTNLMPLLRTVEHIWSVEQRQRNAEEIAKRAGLMFDKMAGVMEAFEGVSGHLSKAQQAHGLALDRLSRGNGNLLGQFDTLRRLGARTGKEMPVEFDEEPDAPTPRLAGAEPAE
jgi:DNA recombination protein RmuC